jgi:hypothetical protein
MDLKIVRETVTITSNAQRDSNANKEMDSNLSVDALEMGKRAGITVSNLKRPNLLKPELPLPLPKPELPLPKPVLPLPKSMLSLPLPRPKSLLSTLLRRPRRLIRRFLSIPPRSWIQPESPVLKLVPHSKPAKKTPISLKSSRS